MKNIYLIATALLLTTASNAATTGDIYLQGEVLAINELIIVPTVYATSLNLAAGEVDRKVATTTERSNSLSGYTISMRSLNSSKLNHSVLGATYNAPYTIKYHGVTTPPLTTVDQVVKTISSLPSLTTDTSDILVSIVGNASLPPGFYTDVITVSIAAN